jgi:hypothetical protein
MKKKSNQTESIFFFHPEASGGNKKLLTFETQGK